MLGFSMIQLTRNYPHKLDRGLKQQLVGLYRPFRWVPCFLHAVLERIVKKIKTFDVIVELEEDLYNCSFEEIHAFCKAHFRSEVKHEYQSISCCSATLSARAIEELLHAHGQVRKIHTDRPVKALLDTALPSIHADLLQQQGLDGKGVTVAIIDTGIYPHPDLTKPVNRIKFFKDFVKNRTKPYDDNGHGTHCAGDAAGNGYASNGKYKGVAPEANLIGVKVLDRTGSGSISKVMSGVQWCIDNKNSLKIDVISMSLGSSAAVSAAEDPLVKLVEKAWDNGIVVCVAAGNEGPDDKTISSPGISPKVITVGAMDDLNTTSREDDQAALFSSRGPTIDGIIKPDLLTPGVNIVSLRSPWSYLDKTARTNRVEGDYFNLSGTSMATPICAGVAALVLQVSPEFTPDNVKEKLISTAEDRGLPGIIQGHGYVNAETAVLG